MSSVGARGVNARFPAEVRVRSGRDYRRAFADNRRVSTRHFSLHLHLCDGGFCRLGLAVSRKVSPDAVVRNRIKRQVRESFRLRYHELPAGDCIVVARPGAKTLNKTALRAELTLLWDRLLALPSLDGAGTMACLAGAGETHRPAAASFDPSPASPTPDGAAGE